MMLLPATGPFNEQCICPSGQADIYFPVMQQDGQALAQHKRKQYGCSRLHQWPNAGRALMSTSLGRCVYAFMHPEHLFQMPVLLTTCCGGCVSCESPVKISMPARVTPLAARESLHSSQLKRGWLVMQLNTAERPGKNLTIRTHDVVCSHEVMSHDAIGPAGYFEVELFTLPRVWEKSLRDHNGRLDAIKDSVISHYPE